LLKSADYPNALGALATASLLAYPEERGYFNELFLIVYLSAINLLNRYGR